MTADVHGLGWMNADLRGRGPAAGAALRKGFLATSSMVAVVVALSSPASAGPCTPTPAATLGPGHVDGCDNTGTLSSISVNNATVVSLIANGGTITGGITITNSDLAGGGITDTGYIAGGIKIDAASIVQGSSVLVQGTNTFGGGISNAGTISNGVIVLQNSNFSGGVSNSGTIKNVGGVVVSGYPIYVVSDSTFTGGITNSGTLSGLTGIYANTVTAFGGGIANSGTISANHNGISVGSVGAFSGDISNSGTITATAGVGIQVGSLANPVSNFNNSVINSGSITSANTGILISHGGTFQGSVSNSGTITATNGAGILIDSPVSFAGGITNSGTITVTTPGLQSGIGVKQVATFSGGISNSGTINAGPSNYGINVSLGNTFVGGITNSGRLSGGTGINIFGLQSFGGGITNTGTGTISGGISVFSVSTFTGGITNNGTINGGLDLGVSVTISQTGGAINGTIRLSTDQLNITGGSINGNVIGNGFDKILIDVGGGGFTYASPFAITGIDAVTVNSGTVLMNGSLAANTVTVNGGTFGGTGTVTGAVAFGGSSTLMPGLPNTPGGTLTINGNLTLSSAVTYLVNVAPSSTSLSQISGTTALAGTVQANLKSGFYAAGTKFDILSSQGGVSGTFGNLVANNSVTASLSQDANNVYLNVKSNPLMQQMNPPSTNPPATNPPSTNPPSTNPPSTNPPSTNPQQPNPQQGGQPQFIQINPGNVATAIDSVMLSTGNLALAFQALYGNLPRQQLLDDLTQLSGEPATGAQLGSFQLTSSFMSLLTGPGGGSAGGSGPAFGFAPETANNVPPDIAMAYASVLKAPPAAYAPRWNSWGAAFGGSKTTSGDPVIVGSRDVTASTGGFAAGIDYRLDPFTVAGFSLAGGGTGWSLAGGAGGGHGDVFLAGFYGSRQIGQAYVTGALTYASNWLSTSRTITVNGPDTLTANFNAQNFGGRLEGGYRLTPWTPFSVIPYAAVQAQAYRSPRYSETGSLGAADPFALTFASQTATAVRSEIGSRFDQSLAPSDNGALHLFGRLAYAHDWQSNPALSATFIGLPTATFVVNGAAPAKDLGLVTTGAEWRWHSGWSVLAKFDGEFAGHSQTYTGTGQVRYSW